MTDRQKFWLKVVLAVTFPVWFVPASFCACLVLAGCIFWEAASSIVDPRPVRYANGKRMP